MTYIGCNNTYKKGLLNAVDDEFYSMYEKEPNDKLCIDYIRNNSQYFEN